MYHVTVMVLVDNSTPHRNRNIFILAILLQFYVVTISIKTLAIAKSASVQCCWLSQLSKKKTRNSVYPNLRSLQPSHLLIASVAAYRQNRLISL